ncbi:hypothetical protein ACEPAF_8559 [Sanghuangporus sanghuang]
MPQLVPSLAEAFPFAPATPLLQVPHPVHFPRYAQYLLDFNFAQLITLPGHPMLLYPWHPDYTALPNILIAALRSFHHPCPDTATLIFLLYIWASPDAQQLLCQDPRLSGGNWGSFCDLLADAFPAAIPFPARHVPAMLQIIPELFARHHLTPANKATLVCRIRETLRIGGALTTIPIILGAPLGDGVLPNAPLAILREGPIALENAVIYSDAASELSHNAIIQVLRLFDERGDDDIRDCAANVIAIILQAQQYSLSAITATQDIEEHLAELRESIEHHPYLNNVPQQDAADRANPPPHTAAPIHDPPMIDLTTED